MTKHPPHTTKTEHSSQPMCLRWWSWGLWTLSFFLFPQVTLFAGGPSQVRPQGLRMALVIGHNQGDRELKPLRFAEQDAKRFASVLRELGGYSSQQVRLLLGPSLAHVKKSMAEIKRSLRDTGRSGVFLLYYSGHSYKTHFQLGKERLYFKEILGFVRQLPVKVRLMFVDSCFSGQLIRGKGKKIRGKGIRRTNSSWRPAPIQIEGTAILASSEAKGRSYESDRISSSFFTSGLIAGLRGAADRNRDQRVSFSEIRNYVYSSTINHSLQSGVDIQRPVYRDDLRGQGDLFLTFLRGAESQLLFGKALEGHFFLYKGDELVYEFRKSPGKRVTVGLNNGQYQIRLYRKNWLGTSKIKLAAKASHRVVKAGFAWQQRSVRDQLKGGEDTELATGLGFLLHYTPMESLANHSLGASLRLDVARWLRLGLRYQYGFLNDQAFPYVTHTLGLPVAFGYGLGFDSWMGWFGVFAEPRLGIRTLSVVNERYADLSLVFGATFSVDYHPLSPTWSVRVSGTGGFQLAFFDGVSRIAPMVEINLGIIWRI